LRISKFRRVAFAGNDLLSQELGVMGCWVHLLRVNSTGAAFGLRDYDITGMSERVLQAWKLDILLFMVLKFGCVFTS